MTEPRQLPATVAPGPGAEILQFTRQELQGALAEAGERVGKAERTKARAEMKAALAAQAAAHEAEIARRVDELKRDHLADREEYAVHRVRAARWFALGVGLFAGGVAAAALTFGIMRGTLTSGADLGIDASTKTRIIEEQFRRSQDPQPAPDYPRSQE